MTLSMIFIRTLSLMRQSIKSPKMKRLMWPFPKLWTLILISRPKNISKILKDRTSSCMRRLRWPSHMSQQWCKQQNTTIMKGAHLIKSYLLHSTRRKVHLYTKSLITLLSIRVDILTKSILRSKKKDTLSRLKRSTSKMLSTTLNYLSRFANTKLRTVISKESIWGKFRSTNQRF